MMPAQKKRKLSPSPNEGGINELLHHYISSGQSSEEERDDAGEEKPAPSSKPTRNEARSVPVSLANGAYDSSVFQLQVNELLSKMRPNYARRMVKAENALRRLKNIIERIPNREPKSISQAEREQQENYTEQIPFPSPRPDREAKYTVAYSKPATINVVGSYARKTAIRAPDQLVIDLAVTMPADVFQDKDYLNYRYFHKRAYYLACIATGIKEDKDCSLVVELAYQNDNHLQPVIIITPGQGDDDFSKSDCRIRIILAAGGAIFPQSKTLPDKNCVRTKIESVNSSDLSATPTPFYNATLRSECSSLTYLKFIHGASLQSDGFVDACILGSVWLHQRGLGTGLASGGFGAFEWACSMALLLQGGGPKGNPVLSKGYSSYQLFKATLLYLSMKDMVVDPVIIPADQLDFPPHDDPILFDAINGMNILFKMTSGSYAVLRHEASCTLRLLKDPLSNQFDACFITNLNDSTRRFDCVIYLPESQPHISPTQTADAIDGDIAFCRKVHQALRRGLADRVLLVNVNLAGKHTWSPSKPKQHARAKPRFQIGLLLNPEQSNRAVDRGPSAEDKEAAAEFREFWGEKAELRRFKDGSIQESLVWSQTDPGDSILKQIVTHIIRRHFGDEAVHGLKLVGESLGRLLPFQSAASTNHQALYQPVMKAFEMLEKDIRNLQGLPLQIRQISASDPQLRYTSTKMPVLDPYQCQMDQANVCVQFEGSNRWPDDIKAIQHTKIAFLLKMGELLEETITNSTARIGLENTDHDLLNTAFLDILYPTGAIFRLRIHHEREHNLLERTLKDGNHTQASHEGTASALSAYKRSFVQAPLHTQAVRTLSTRYPLLSPSIRLMKKWRDSHLLTAHINDEVVELLTIRTFLHPGPWSVPGSVLTGFLRTLTFVSQWDWRSEPLIVDLSGEMSSKETDAIHLRFEGWRKIDPAMNRVVMFAASNIDPHGIAWTEFGPSKVIAGRFTRLAKAACAVVKEQDIHLEPEQLFAVSMLDYDFVVHLNPKFVGEKLGSEKPPKPVYKNLRIHTQEDERLVGFNPVQMYVNELRRLYGNTVLFFYDGSGGAVIAGLFNPQTGPRPWKIGLPYNSMPVASSRGKAYVTINIDATLHDIARLGDDMVSRIEKVNGS